MSQTMPANDPQQPEIRLTRTDHYRDSYANSVQVRMSVWDFQLVFGTMQQDSARARRPAQLPGHLPQPAAGQGSLERPRPQPGPVRADLRQAGPRARAPPDSRRPHQLAHRSTSTSGGHAANPPEILLRRRAGRKAAAALDALSSLLRRHLPLALVAAASALLLGRSRLLHPRGAGFLPHRLAHPALDDDQRTSAAAFACCWPAGGAYPASRSTARAPSCAWSPRPSPCWESSGWRARLPVRSSPRSSRFLTALYPVWFAQSTLAHADIFAAVFTLWALSFYFERYVTPCTHRHRLLGGRHPLLARRAGEGDSHRHRPIALALWEIVLLLTERGDKNSPASFGWASPPCHAPSCHSARALVLVSLAAKPALSSGIPSSCATTPPRTSPRPAFSLSLWHRVIHI